MSSINPRKNLDVKLAALRVRWGSAQGKKHWRSLEELAESNDFKKLIEQEYPEQAALWPNMLSRRKFFTLMGASLALAGISGCSVKPAPSADLVPYVKPPEEALPGRPLFYATTMTFAGTATGLLVESHEGRPTKIEGNPDHPASRGATDIFHQASVLTLYDPDRAKTVTLAGQTRTWGDALAAMRRAMLKQRDKHGAGIRILTETIVSPTLADQLNNLFKDLPEAKWHVYEPIHRDAAWQGSQLAFGEDLSPIYDFSKADVVLSLDADFLQCSPGNLRYAADFMARRRVRTAEKDASTSLMNRLYMVETSVSCTGAKADHRLALRPSEIAQLAREIAAKLEVIPKSDHESSTANSKWIAAVAKDLTEHRGRSLVLAGDRQPAAIHLLAHVINDHLGNVGQTVNNIAPIDAKPGNRTASLQELVKDMEQGKVEFLLILGGNPVYSAPVDLKFANALKKVPLSVHHGLYVDETSYQCNWHLPEAHYLEAWSDARAFEGTASIVQPLIEPLYQGRSAHEVMAWLANLQETPGREIVKNHWNKYWDDQHQEGGFEPFWKKCLHDGLIPNTASSFKSVKLKEDWQKHLNEQQSSSPPLPKGDERLELVFQPDPTIYDGSWANNGWLQELPKPVTKLTWGNAAMMSPATAKRLGIKLGSYAHGGEHGGYYMPVVELHVGDRSIWGPAWIVPGHADDAVTVFLGNGREMAGQIGGTVESNVGFNAYLLRTASEPWFAANLQVQKRNEKEVVACTQAHHSMEGREPVRAMTLKEFQANPQFVSKMEEQENEEVLTRQKSPSLLESYDYAPPKPKWGMAIDLTACVSCNACVVACQAENNIAVVGKEQVSRGREMHWLRIDRYMEGPADSPTRFHFQPVPCMHCENAPCEYVCPTEATVHSAEGLNDMIYQRCVGTRFCSDNCPYKVRRFNFLFYSDFKTPTRRLLYNPDVTVRSRGVMEKCSYCVQRIRKAEIDTQTENRRLADGEVLTACQAVCPTQAIVFGDMNDPQSAVVKLKNSPLNYGLLTQLNTNPRTSYLAELRNPNPELEA